MTGGECSNVITHLSNTSSNNISNRAIGALFGHGFALLRRAS